jgi:hypothetical protein
MRISRLFASAVIASLYPVSLGCQSPAQDDHDTTEAMTRAASALTGGDGLPPTPVPVPEGTTFTPTNEEPGTEYPVDVVCPDEYQGEPRWKDGVCVRSIVYRTANPSITTTAFRRCDRYFNVEKTLGPVTYSSSPPNVVCSSECSTIRTGAYYVDRGIADCPVGFTLKVVPSACRPSEGFQTTTRRQVQAAGRDHLESYLNLRPLCSGGGSEFESPDFTTGVCVSCQITSIEYFTVNPERCAGLPGAPAAPVTSSLVE